MPFPQTEVPGRLQAELMSRGLRMTHQRRTILSVVETAKQHLDASQILRKAHKLDPQIKWDLLRWTWNRNFKNTRWTVN